MKNIHGIVLALGAAILAQASGARATTFNFDAFGDNVEANANLSMTFGAQMRTQDRAANLVGKSNANPDLCGRTADGRPLYQSCQGLFREQVYPASRLADSKGQYTVNADDGNWNYAQHDLTQAPLTLRPDISLEWNDWTFFARGLLFYDFVNQDFREHHPNRITSDNLDDVGFASMPGSELLPGPIPTLGVRSDSRPCPASRNPSGGPCGLVYGRGGVVDNKRGKHDKKTLRQIGSDIQVLDFFVAGSIDVPALDRELSIKAGRQIVNWGETTLLFFDSLSQANPQNFDNFFRVGNNLLEDNLLPIGMVDLQMNVFENANLEVFYQLEWIPTEAPAYGSFYSFADFGTDNAGPDTLNLGFGNLVEDPERVASLLDNPLSAAAHTSAAIRRGRDRQPGSGGQYGISLKYYAEDFNNGTEFGFYYMNYHARLPYVSFTSAPEACSKHARNTAEFLAACPNIPLLHGLLSPNDPQGATDDVTQFDQISAFLDYPRDIHMFGVSFNTTVLDFSVQGEVAYRPNNPLQVDVEDLAFAAYGPVFTNCHLPGSGCSGTNVGGLVTLPGGVTVPASVGTMPDGTTGIYGSSDYVVDANGTPGAFPDTLGLVAGHVPGSGRSFPSFIVPYRGGTLGLNEPNARIRGWERFKTLEVTLGATYVMEASHWLNLIRADQIIWIFETGATWVPDLPSLDKLQLEAPGTFTHASAGADGSGADRSRQACSTNVACSYGPDGLRFNPHQQDLSMYPDEFSAGYVIAAQIKYESVLPKISLSPQLVWKHDVKGTSPGPATNFIEDRRLADALLEIRYKDRLAFYLGYQWFTGGGGSNLLRDRDSARAYVKYAF